MKKIIILIQECQNNVEIKQFLNVLMYKLSSVRGQKNEYSLLVFKLTWIQILLLVQNLTLILWHKGGVKGKALVDKIKKAKAEMKASAFDESTPGNIVITDSKAT